MLKAYGLGFLVATIAVVLVAVFPIGSQESQQPGLLWGDRVYSSKQEFKRYLKSKGLNYETWLARNPGAAPWEPDEIGVGPVIVRATPEARERWVVRLPLFALALAIATGCALLGLRRVRSVMPRHASRSLGLASAALTGLLGVGIWFGTHVGRLRPASRSFARGSPAVSDPHGPRSGGPPLAGRPALPSIRRFGVAAAGAARPLLASRQIYLERLARTASARARLLRTSAPIYMERLVRTASARARLLSRLMPERQLTAGDVAFRLLLVTTAIVFALFVTLVVSA